MNAAFDTVTVWAQIVCLFLLWASQRYTLKRSMKYWEFLLLIPPGVLAGSGVGWFVHHYPATFSELLGILRWSLMPVAIIAVIVSVAAAVVDFVNNLRKRPAEQ